MEAGKTNSLFALRISFADFVVIFTGAQKNSFPLNGVPLRKYFLFRGHLNWVSGTVGSRKDRNTVAEAEGEIK
jgi:hypothetical protein